MQVILVNKVVDKERIIGKRGLMTGLPDAIFIWNGKCWYMLWPFGIF
jgi:hypothetical protein